VGTSVAGTAHRLAGRRCEDSFGWVQPGPGLVALVLADGVSGAGRGGEGAELATLAACDYLDRTPGAWGELECAAAVDHADEQLRRAGGAAAGALSTTLVVALLTACPGRARVSLARVGDSTAFVLAGGEEWTELFYDRAAGEAGMQHTATGVLPFAGAGPGGRVRATEAGGEEAGGRTGIGEGFELGVDAGGVESASTELGGDMVLLLVTDGVADPLRDGPSTVAPALAEVLRARPSPLSLAGAADFSRRGAHDDRTILAAWLRNPSWAG
jgi:serine/threonine protein phosphatase PrpC